MLSPVTLLPLQLWTAVVGKEAGLGAACGHYPGSPPACDLTRMRWDSARGTVTWPLQGSGDPALCPGCAAKLLALGLQHVFCCFLLFT